MLVEKYLIHILKVIISINIQLQIKSKTENSLERIFGKLYLMQEFSFGLSFVHFKVVF